MGRDSEKYGTNYEVLEALADIQLLQDLQRDYLLKMSSPEEKQKRIKRRSNYAKELEKKQYRKQVVEDKKKAVDVQRLSHSELVELIQEEDLDSE